MHGLKKENLQGKKLRRPIFKFLEDNFREGIKRQQIVHLIVSVNDILSMELPKSYQKVQNKDYLGKE